MSNSRAWTWRHAITRSGLPPTTRHVLLTISLFMNEMGEGCYPTQKQLADATGLSERAVRQHLEVAENAGWIKRTEHGFRGQRWRNHEYHAVWPEPQDVEKGAERGSGPSEEGAEPHAERCGTSRKKVRHDVPPNIPDNIPPTSPEGAQARGRMDFEILWSDWPADQRPDHRETAQKLFDKMTWDDQIKAVAGAAPYRRTMALRGKSARMITFLREKAFNDFHDNPEVDKDGDFVIRPGQPEWSAWLGAIRREYGGTVADSSAAKKIIVRKHRWPLPEPAFT